MVKTVLRVLPSEKYLGSIVSLIKENNGKSIIYVTANKPHDEVERTLKKQLINSF